MKKILATMAVFAMATALFTGCKKDTPAPDSSGVSLSIPTALSIQLDGATPVTITASDAAEADITVQITSSDASIAAPEASSVILKKGEKSATIAIKGLKAGSADITISARNAEITAGTCKATVSAGPDPNSEVYELEVLPADWGGWQFYLDGTYSFNFFPVSYDRDGIILQGSISIDSQGGQGIGEYNDKGVLLLSALAEGTVIKTEDMKDSGADRPIIWSGASAQNYTALATGEPVYIAFMGADNFGSPSGQYYRAWVKIIIDPAGGFSALEVIEGAACMSDTQEFKVGQKQ